MLWRPRLPIIIRVRFPRPTSALPAERFTFATRSVSPSSRTSDMAARPALKAEQAARLRLRLRPSLFGFSIPEYAEAVQHGAVLQNKLQGSPPPEYVLVYQDTIKP